MMLKLLCKFRPILICARKYIDIDMSHDIIEYSAILVQIPSRVFDSTLPVCRILFRAYVTGAHHPYVTEEALSSLFRMSGAGSMR